MSKLTWQERIAAAEKRGRFTADDIQQIDRLHTAAQDAAPPAEPAQATLGA